MDPMTAVSQVLMSKNSSTVSRPNSTWARNPPRMAPTIPTMIVTMMPPGSSPGRIALARAPAISPSTIQPMIPMPRPFVAPAAQGRPVSPWNERLDPGSNLLSAPRQERLVGVGHDLLERDDRARLGPGGEVHPVDQSLHQPQAPAPLRLEQGGLGLQLGRVEAVTDVDHPDHAEVVLQVETDLVLVSGPGVEQHVGAGLAQGQLDVIDAGRFHAALLHGVADDMSGHGDRLLVPWQGQGQREFHAGVVP